MYEKRMLSNSHSPIALGAAGEAKVLVWIKEEPVLRR